MYKNNIKYNEPIYYEDKEKYFYEDFKTTKTNDTDVVATKPLEKIIFAHELIEWRNSIFCFNFVIDAYNYEVIYFSTSFADHPKEMFSLVDKVFENYLDKNTKTTVYTHKDWQYISDEFLEICNKYNLDRVLVVPKKELKYNEQGSVNLKPARLFMNWIQSNLWDKWKLPEYEQYHNDKHELYPIIKTKIIQELIYEWNNNKVITKLNASPIQYREEQGYKRKRLEILLNIIKYS